MWFLWSASILLVCLFCCQIYKNLKRFVSFLRFFNGPLEVSELFFSQIPPLTKGWVGPFHFYAIAKPEYVKIILNSPHAVSKMNMFYKFFEPIAGNGIFNAEIASWKRNRKIVLPAFKPLLLKSFVKVFVKKSKILCDILEQRSHEEFDVHPVVAKCTLDTILETTIGVEVTQELEEMSECLERLAEICFTRMLTFWYHPDCIYKLTKLYREEKLLTRKFHNFVIKLIDTKKSCPETNPPFLDLLLNYSSNNSFFSSDQIKEELQTIIFAGFDTTANTISFVLLMLAMHPEVQEKVHQEVVSVVGLNRDIEPEDLDSLHYLECVIKETLRLFPVATLIGRDIQDDIQLEEDSTIPKNSLVVISIISIHRNPEIWRDPLKFEPDRFLEETETRHAYSFIPFSGGSRNCIGAKYGMMSMKTVIATIIRKFVVCTSYQQIEDIKLTLKLTLKAANGWKVCLKQRKYI